jgi:hypothetical protein
MRDKYIATLLTRSREIQQKEGLLKLAKRGGLFLVSPIYKRNLFYLYERPIRPDTSLTETQLKINTSKLRCVAVASNEEADKLEKEGFLFRSHPTDWNIGLKTYRRWLEEGVVAFCTFVGKDFAAINWVILTETAQKRVTLPVKIDYANHKVFPRGFWVNPKYRGLGLIRYTVYYRDIFLAKRGINATQGFVENINKTGSGLSESLGARIYGHASLTRFLFWKFWKETYEN